MSQDAITHELKAKHRRLRQDYFKTAISLKDLTQEDRQQQLDELTAEILLVSGTIAQRQEH